MPAQIGWGIKEKLLYKLKQIIRKKAKPSAQEIGWGTEEKLIYEASKAAAKANTNP
jgi:hypothetical protein